MRVNNRVLKRTDSLRFKLSLIAAFFSTFILCFSGFTTYANQMRSYKAMCLENVRNVGYYLEKLIQDSAEEFLYYQKYYMEHFADVDVPYDFDDYNLAQRKMLMMLFNSKNEIFDSDAGINPDAFSDEEKKAYFIYTHEYWLLTFEHAREAFNLPYTYYIVPKEDEYKMVYMIDGERSYKGPDGKKAEQGEFLYLGDEYYNAPEEYPVQWNTWFTGEIQNDFQIWNNAWGYTYAYYIPLIINGQKLGLIGTEIKVENVNKAILHNTLKLTGFMAAALVFLFALLMAFINQRYIQKVVRLETLMRKFARNKDPKIVSEIREGITGNNEITLVCHQFADMILELEKYMNNLVETNKELQVTRHHADLMNELANKDSLTGIRNKTAYDNEVVHIEAELAAGRKEFGIVMIDLNYLKQINDTYGHALGNVSIKKLCEEICAVFVHSPVFRVGGDEFVVILENSAYENVVALIERLNENLDSLRDAEGLEQWERVSAAVGYALYDDKIDTGVASVFKRADKAMYERKHAMKAER